jgi:hypothetical protein
MEEEIKLLSLSSTASSRETSIRTRRAAREDLKRALEESEMAKHLKSGLVR